MALAMNRDYDEAYILRTIDYQEHSKLIYMYTASGIKSGLARGVKKMQSPLRHLMQTGMLLSVDLSKGKLPTIKDAEMLTYYKSIKEDLIKTTIVSVINELIYYNVSDHDDHQKLFQFIKKVLDALSLSDSPLEILNVFELKFLYFLGYGIQFNRCSACSKVEPLFFDSHSGMVFCEEHLEHHQHALDKEAFAPLQYFLHVDIEKFKPLNLDKQKHQRLQAIIDDLYDVHLSARPKAKKILKSLD